MHFTKYTGLGNDFIFLDGPAALSVADPAALARRLCNRRTGIGADGLVLLLPSQKAAIRMRIINSDGSEAEMCGNASRCVPLHLLKHGLTQNKQITLETLAGLIKTEVLDESKGLVRVNMGVPRTLRGEIPMKGAPQATALNAVIKIGSIQHTGTGVSMGNPHFVMLVDDVENAPVAEVGPLVETNPAFPQKTNVEFVQVLNSNSVRMRVWERGAGITQACGTGACASAVACILNKLTGPRVTVQLDGGELIIEWPQQQEIFMTGHAQLVFEGDIEL